MKKVKLLLAVGIASAAFSMVSFAGEWKQGTAGWWYQNDDGSYPTNAWQWIDSNQDGTSECYYFDANGYILFNTSTPDGCMVNADGAWIIDGVVQTQSQSTAVTTTENKQITSAHVKLQVSKLLRSHPALFLLFHMTDIPLSSIQIL